MTDITYSIVPHDGGYAYRVGDTLSETYQTQALAEAAAEDAARRRHLADDATEPDATIEYQDDRGRWRTERSGPDDRPETGVDGRHDD